MIYNRTINDIIAAKQIYENKVKKFQTLTDEDIEQLERGYLTKNTLNRIEDKTEEIKDTIYEMGYLNIDGISTETWSDTDYFKRNDFLRILQNLDILKSAFMAYRTTPTTPQARYYFSNLNDIEKILFDLDNLIDNVKENYRICGDYNCGE